MRREGHAALVNPQRVGAKEHDARCWLASEAGTERNGKGNRIQTSAVRKTSGLNAENAHKTIAKEPWCPGPESNRHALRRGILSPLRLPISPPGRREEGSPGLWHSRGYGYHPFPTYPTIEDAIGRTPLVALQRIGARENAERGTVVLGKLEGNNPAGSVKDRPALSMIRRAEERGEIKPGDTLIEATSGNTGIALAMAAAIKGYRMVLVMPEDLSVERAQTMKAFGAEPDPHAQERRHGVRARPGRGHGAAGQGRGARPVRQPGQPAHPLRNHRARAVGADGRAHHALRERHGYDRHDHGRVALPEGKEPCHPDHRCAAQGRLAHSGHPQVAAGIPAQDLRSAGGGRDDQCRPGRCGGHVPPPRARGGHLRGHLRGGRLLGRTGDRAARAGCDHRLRGVRPGDRYLSTGVFPA